MVCNASNTCVVYCPVKLTGNYAIEYTVTACSNSTYGAMSSIINSNTTTELESGATNLAYIELGSSSSWSRISINTNGTNTDYFSPTFSFQSGDKFKITVNNHVISVYRNDTLIKQVTDTNHNFDGYFGFRQYSGRTKTVKDVKIYAL